MTTTEPTRAPEPFPPQLTESQQQRATDYGAALNALAATIERFLADHGEGITTLTREIVFPMHSVVHTDPWLDRLRACGWTQATSRLQRAVDALEDMGDPVGEDGRSHPLPADAGAELVEMPPAPAWLNVDAFVDQQELATIAIAARDGQRLVAEIMRWATTWGPQMLNIEDRICRQASRGQSGTDAPFDIVELVNEVTGLGQFLSAARAGGSILSVVDGDPAIAERALERFLTDVEREALDALTPDARREALDAD